MTRKQKNLHRRTAWVLIVGSVGVCSTNADLAAAMIFIGVLYAAGIEFYAGLWGGKQR